MRYFQVLSTLLALWLAGCAAGAKQQAKVVTPPPPPPVATTLPPPPQPLSIPQTQAQLPPPQPIDPEALATEQLPAQPSEAQPNPASTSRPARRPAGPVAGPKPESAAGSTSVPPQPPAAAPGGNSPEAEPRATVQEIVPPAELKRLSESVNARQVEVRKVLELAVKNFGKLTPEQRNVVLRIQSFLIQSEEAAKRGDLRQADILAERAQVLAKELSTGNQ